MTMTEQLAAVKGALDIPVSELWIKYFANGGMAGPVELEAYLSGAYEFTTLEHDILAVTLNEELAGRGMTERVAFARDGHRTPPD